MRILVEQSAYGMTNHGDTAMLQVSVRRLEKLWAKAYIEVITSNAALPKEYCPTAHPLVDTWHERSQQVYLLADHQIDVIGQEKGHVDAVRKADFVMASGGGYIKDTFLSHGAEVLARLEEAINMSKPIAVMGQGFEPLSNPALRAKAQCVLPESELVGCRERRIGRATLVALGVDPTRIVVTGDDSVELSYRERLPAVGAGIGVNLRVAWYSGVDERKVEILREVLHRAARKHGAPLIPLPISMRSPSDAEYIKQLLKGYTYATNIGGGNLDDPLKIIGQTGRCRVVVAGSYHAAVFALSQGIPVIGLSQSPNYMNKFQGLNAQFGDDCHVLSFDDVDFPMKFAHALDQAWETAEQARPGLLENAEHQIEAGLAAYQRLYRQIEARSASVRR